MIQPPGCVISKNELIKFEKIALFTFDDSSILSIDYELDLVETDSNDSSRYSHRDKTDVPTPRK